MVRSGCKPGLVSKKVTLSAFSDEVPKQLKERYNQLEIQNNATEKLITAYIVMSIVYCLDATDLKLSQLI